MGVKSRQDVGVLISSLLFVVAFLEGIWLWGNAKGWDAPSGFHYNDVNTTRLRFLPEPFGCNDTSVPGRSGVQCDVHWYFWKLPPQDVTTLTRAMVWIFYSSHQLLIWILLYRAQAINSNTKQGKKYGTNLQWFNWAMLSVNAFFHVIHLVHTHWTYDGLAQDVNMTSSQGSVIMMTSFIMLVEYKDRGLLLMWPNSKSKDRVTNWLRFRSEPITLVRKYHGYAFSWAVIYTFWYHPMENTLGHLLGFFHTAIVMLQGSLIFTKIHLNRYWRLLNESWVLIHATIMALQVTKPNEVNMSDFWPVFAFGFGFLFAFTQVFGLPFWKRISSRYRIMPPIIYFAILLGLCATIVTDVRDRTKPGFHRIYILCFVPSNIYMCALIGWVFTWLWLKIDESLSAKCANANRKDFQGRVKQAAYIDMIVSVFALFVILGVLTRNPSGPFVVFMIVNSAFISFGTTFTLFFFKKLFAIETRTKQS